MNSTELIESCKKAFEECHEERDSFEDELARWLYHKYQLTMDMKELEYFTSSCKSFQWRSFYNGYLLGITKHLKDE